MENILNFLKEWSPYIVSGIIVVLDILILLLKRRPKTFDDFILALHDVRAEVACFVSDVEVPGEGSAKKNEVIKLSLDLLSRLLKRPLSDTEITMATNDISRQIEEVLEAPQKKGVQYGTK